MQPPACCQTIPPKGGTRSVSHHQSPRGSPGHFPALTRLLLCPHSLIKRMAQSVVEVMEDAKGKVQENLLANGGRSPLVVTATLSRLVLAHRQPRCGHAVETQTIRPTPTPPP